MENNNITLMDTINITGNEELWSDWDELKEEYSYIGIGVTIGCALQFVAKRCRRSRNKNNDLLDLTKSNEQDPVIVEPDKKINRFKRIIRKLRGGAIDPGTLALILKIVAEIGPHLGLAGGIVAYIAKNGSKINLFSTLYKSLPQNLPIKSLVSIKDKLEAIKDLGYHCGTETGEFILQILSDSSLSLEEKQKMIYKILTDHFRLNTQDAILCIVMLLFLLYFGNLAGYLALIRALCRALKDGKISPELFRLIMRRLRRKNGGYPLEDPCIFD
jgi:hypothetical protein